MKYNELVLQRQKSARRVGRGIAAGRGKTAGRGTKGQGARKSGGVRPGFEGGQMPLYMRLPKLRGFKSFKQSSECVYTPQLNKLNKQLIDTKSLYEAGLISNPHVKVKLLYSGDIETKKEVKLQSASKKAIETIEKSGGSFLVVERLERKSNKTKTSEQPDKSEK